MLAEPHPGIFYDKIADRHFYHYNTHWNHVDADADGWLEHGVRMMSTITSRAHLDYPVVATGDVRHARPEGRALLDAFLCLRHKTSLDRAGRHLSRNAERHLKSREESLARFADRPDWLRESRNVAERCEFTLANLGYARSFTFDQVSPDAQSAVVEAIQQIQNRVGADQLVIQRLAHAM